MSPVIKPAFEEFVDPRANRAALSFSHLPPQFFHLLSSNRYQTRTRDRSNPTRLEYTCIYRICGRAVGDFTRHPRGRGAAAYELAISIAFDRRHLLLDIFPRHLRTSRNSLRGREPGCFSRERWKDGENPGFENRKNRRRRKRKRASPPPPPPPRSKHR